MEVDKTVSKLVKNEILTAFARVAMVISTAVILPASLTLMFRLLSSMDEANKKLDTTSTKVELLEQGVRLRDDILKSSLERIQFQVTDHEGRIRFIERGKPN